MKKKFVKLFWALAAFILAALGLISYKHYTEPKLQSLYGVFTPLSTESAIPSNLRMYEGKIGSNTAKELIEYINALNLNEIYPYPITSNITSSGEIIADSYYNVKVNREGDSAPYHLSVTINNYSGDY